ncbi:MAG: hypothetical protein V8Q76_10205 [Bacteroides intestinalis]
MVIIQCANFLPPHWHSRAMGVAVLCHYDGKAVPQAWQKHGYIDERSLTCR